jgi:hypothetical protein
MYYDFMIIRKNLKKKYSLLYLSLLLDSFRWKLLKYVLLLYLCCCCFFSQKLGFYFYFFLQITGFNALSDYLISPINREKLWLYKTKNDPLEDMGETWNRFLNVLIRNITCMCVCVPTWKNKTVKIKILFS